MFPFSLKLSFKCLFMHFAVDIPIAVPVNVDV